MSDRRRASMWEYMAVAYRSAREPRDHLAWMKRPHAVCSPRLLWREMRSPWWPRRSLWTRLAWLAAALVSTAALIGLAFVATTLLVVPAAAAGPVMVQFRSFASIVLLCIAGLWAWPAGILAFIALRLPDRDLVPLRRVRTAGAHPWEPETAGELLRRRAFWSDTLRRWRSGALERRHWSVDPRPVLFQTAVSIGTLMSLWLYLHRLYPIGVFFALMIGLTIVNVIGVRRLRGSLRDRIAGAVEVRACPDCGYSLEGAPGRPTDAAALAAWAGPRRCPECGSPWPLIPPPPPRLVNAYGDEVHTGFERAMRGLGAGLSAAFTPRSGRPR